MDASLRSKTLYALSWSFLESVGLQGVRFVIGIVLARLLFPEQFGLIGMLMIFMAVAQSFLDSGFGAALIQKREVTPTDISSIFYFNIIIGILAAGLLCLGAPWVARFYEQPILTPLTRLLSLSIVANSFGTIQNTILSKEINFKIQTKVSLMAGVISGTIGVILAFQGFGVWSLAVQQISSSALRTIFLWLLNSWRPGLSFSFKSLREMFRFGSRLSAAILLNQVFENIYLVVIGKLFSASDLGFFTRAKTVQDLPSQSISGVVGRVIFPVFSTIQDDSTRLKSALKKALTFLVLVNFPVMIGLAVISRPLVLALLTEKWAECIPYIQLLCIVELLFSAHLININLLQAVGRSDLILRLEIVKKLLIIVNIALTWRWGISAMICGMLASSIVSFFLNSYYTGILVKYSMGEQCADFFPYLLMAALMGIGIYGAGFVAGPNHWVMLFSEITTGIVIYVSLCRIFRLSAFMEIWQAGLNRVTFLRIRAAG